MPLLQYGKKIIFSGVRSSHDSETRRKIFLFNVFSHVAIICLVSLGITAFIQNTPILGVADLSVALTLISLVTYLHFSGNQVFCSVFAATVANFFFCYLFATGGVSSTAFMWLYTYPTLAFFLLNLSWGSFATLFLLLFSAAFLAFDLSNPSVNVYDLDFAIRFVPSFMVVFFFSFLLEKNRVAAQEVLVSKQQELTRLVNKLKGKERQLELAQNELELRVAERTAELLEMNQKFREEIEVRKRTEVERKRLEGELSRAQKMEVLGILAGGVAHDLNNVLSGIVSYPDLMLADISDDDPMRDRLEIIRKSGRNAAAIVQDLLSLARRGVIIKEVLSLNDVIGDYVQSPEFTKLCLSHPEITFQTKLEENLELLQGSSVHLQKTIMNLVINAFEAIDHGGTVAISTENMTLDHPVDGYEVIKSGNYVVFTVQDSGAGMSPEVIEKIFEPFYTRKHMGRSGTGLGMTVVWGTIKDHDGYLDINSVQGEGTTLSVYLPAAPADILMEGKDPLEGTPNTPGNEQTVLIVDDVLEQRKIGVAILEKLGYRAWAVSSGDKALEFLKKQPVNMVLLDMIMPSGMDGLSTYRKILQINPEQKAVLVSGYSENHRVREALQLGIGAYLKKPYTMAEVARVVGMELSR